MTGVPLTSEIVDIILRLAKEGKTVQQIHAVTRVKITTIYERINGRWKASHKKKLDPSVEGMFNVDERDWMV